MLSADRLRELVLYDPETGIFTNRINRRGGVRAGEQPGVVHHTGYLRMAIEGSVYPAHRLAWLYVHKAFPTQQVDHINGDRLDNRIVNLRLADGAENLWNSKRPSNNTSGAKGVNWRGAPHNVWRASIMVRGVRKHLGNFRTFAEASAARAAAAPGVHGEFARNG